MESSSSLKVLKGCKDYYIKKKWKDSYYIIIKKVLSESKDYNIKIKRCDFVKKQNRL